MRIGIGEGHASAFPGKSPAWRPPRLPPAEVVRKKATGRGDALLAPERAGKRGERLPRLGQLLGQTAGSVQPSFLHSWPEAGFCTGIFWEPKDAGSGGQLGVALHLCFPCSSFCLSLDLLFSGKQASGPLIRSLTP